MARTNHALIELVHALHDGVAFYELALKHTRDPVLADTYFRMRHVKTSIAEHLDAQIIDAGDVGHRDGTWIGALRHGYADIAARMSDDPDGNYLASIEAQEDRVLDAFRLAAASDPSEEVRALAKAQVPDVQRMHDEIHNLQRSKAA